VLFISKVSDRGGLVDHGSSMGQAMNGGSRSVLEIKPSHLEFPCKSSRSHVSRLSCLIMVRCCRDYSFLLDLGQSWDLSWETSSAILSRWTCDTLTMAFLSSSQILQNFLDSPSHRILGHIHKTLNIDLKK